MITKYKCPRCGGELSDWWDGEPVSTSIGEWSGNRFRCEGHLKPAKDDRFGDYVWVNHAVLWLFRVGRFRSEIS